MENLVPSIKNTQQIPLKELSPQEFQQMLSAWMEEKGLVQDLKSYLKFQMINILKNTTIGKNIQKTSHTLAQQALHMIVAEYLLHYQWTKLYVQESMVSKFDKDNLLNILELLGISKEYFKTIFYEYFEKNQALLVCLLNTIGQNIVEDTEEEVLAKDYEDDFIKHLHLTLQGTNLPQKTQLLQNLKTCYNLQQKTYQNQVIQLVSKFKKELGSKDQKLHYNHKRKKALEKQINTLKQANSKPSDCLLPHCTQQCQNLQNLNETYRKEIAKLKSINLHQKKEIQRLNRHCTDLSVEFNACQSKISVASAKFDQPDSDRELSLSSDSVTEEILQQAKEKLKLLEEESEELDLRFHKFVIK